MPEETWLIYAEVRNNVLARLSPGDRQRMMRPSLNAPDPLQQLVDSLSGLLATYKCFRPFSPGDDRVRYKSRVVELLVAEITTPEGRGLTDDERAQFLDNELRAQR